MSNCVVRSRGSRLPCSIVADHGIEGSDHLSHDGDDNDPNDPSLRQFHSSNALSSSHTDAPGGERG